LWAKPLAGGATAIGLFNRSEDTSTIILALSDINMKGAKSVTNLWIGTTIPVKNEMSFEVPKHGVVLLRVEK
jgi:alpha-galactosidase